MSPQGLALRSPQAEDHSSGDHAGLRSALRDVRILPAPSSVDELIARLPDEAVPFSSGDLAEIILDARYPDVDPASFAWPEDRERASDDFFAPTAWPANSNARRARSTRKVRLFEGVFTAAMVSGALLIASNALFGPNLAPRRSSELVAHEVAGPAVPGNPAAQDPQSAPEPARVALEEPKPADMFLAGPVIAPAIEATGEPELGRLRPEPAAQDNDAGPLEAPASQEPTAAAEPAAPIDLEPVPAVPEPVIEAAAPADLGTRSRETPDMRPAVPLPPRPPIRPKARAPVPFVGTWAATPEACTAQGGDDLLTSINARRGRAGDSMCVFKKLRRSGNGWDISATCSDRQTSWASDIRLSLARGRLTWASQKGSTTYVRCLRGAGRVKAATRSPPESRPM